MANHKIMAGKPQVSRELLWSSKDLTAMTRMINGFATMDLRNVKKAFDASEDDTWKL